MYGMIPESPKIRDGGKRQIIENNEDLSKMRPRFLEESRAK
jgi:hypothetical protein